MKWQATAVCTFLAFSGQLQWTKGANHNNCDPYLYAYPSRCSASDQRKTSFKELNSLLRDAVSLEHFLPYVVNTTIGLYQFLHPCESEVQAALILFYDENSLVPDHSSPWWGQMSQAMIGRRRRQSHTTNQHFTSENDLPNNELQRLLLDTGNDAGCVQYLIDKYKDAAAQNFKQEHPSFHVPTTTPMPRHTTPTTTPKPTTTTPKPTTTMPKPTTTTTPRPTTRPTTHRPTTEVPTTSAALTTDLPTKPASVTYGPISCTTCSGLMCLLGSHVTAWPDGQFFCVTTVAETDTGRDISRGCASQSSCDSYSQNQDGALCDQVDHQMLPSGNTCNFCCLGDNCNKPPHVKPPASSLYPKP